MLLHQGLGLETFNAMPFQKAVHALYECCNCVTLAGDLARGRPYADREALYRRADDLLFALPEETVDTILEAYPDIGRRPGSVRSRHEPCAVRDDRSETMAELHDTARRYRERFGSPFVMYVDGADADAVLATVAGRLHNDYETERKVIRNELAKINRTRLERMLGPDGGYDNWGG
ncbi:2-oxo-4-hydroxy-4-carboxy-5-ureidoimidazoline decarboxylase [Mycobacterium sp. MYCO198283]|uniref:2-oxo-4-hydroxy-4-carboxy-5-ureidoimidazoline decarboxylase n=1 Tax=Mycobacterium sp. MYCO198283 TaxID=2883505 RepID=UPI001E410F5C|nr:2-oxo-4-hydroxy-4-carboxy-5-ureidoimidazoline decarboxylase [Mycobacterium sp. MYCO198283]MCG5431468.1 2-oxo-4-hydroxy-4-carboxy-5-ureidoimidazoline decarboxylase [Mycobacterium sp. MYCO198283]